MTGPELPEFVLELLVRLRRRGLPIGVDDCLTLRSALAAGFGLASSDDFADLCVALWAKSPAERGTIRAVLNGVDGPLWHLFPGIGVVVPAEPIPEDEEPAAALSEATTGTPETEPVELPAEPGVGEVPLVQRLTGVFLQPPGTGEFDSSLAVAPQFPLAAREIAQTWRRLRRPVRHGPPVEVDIGESLDRYGRTGVLDAPVLIPARRNTARLLLLIDRQGSMTPYSAFVDHLVRQIRNAGRLDAITTWYFHNLPSKQVDNALLEELPDPFSPALDPVLGRIAPLTTGRLYADPDLTGPKLLSAVLRETVPGTAAAIISDAGAARGTLQTSRLLGSLALVKALHAARCPVAWINPVPADRWPATTAEQLARHVPMLPLTAEGMHRAVDVLRGRPRRTERPV